jgi:hypothetical protein
MQHYKNHVKYYTPHHFIFYPVVLMGIIITARYYFKYPALHSVWAALIAIFILIAWLSFMVRQHYALTLQNRLVRMEMRFRYFALTGKRFEPVEQKISFGQLAALRFAGDEELEGLINRAISENLSPTDIKKAITNWQPDEMRV